MTGPCIEWTGATNGAGYGVRRINGRNVLVHRYVYEQECGPIPDGLELRHTCDNPPCYNTEHLIPGTHAENMRDMVERGRAHNFADTNGIKTECPAGHEYDDENTYIYKGKRGCRKCRQAAWRKYDARRRAS